MGAFDGNKRGRKLKKLNSQRQSYDNLPYLIAKGVASNDDGLDPAGNNLGHTLEQDGFSEDSAVENVADGAVGGLVHL